MCFYADALPDNDHLVLLEACYRYVINVATI